MKCEDAAAYAYWVTDPHFAEANKATWYGAYDPERQIALRGLATDVIKMAISDAPPHVSTMWEARRLAALESIRNPDFADSDFARYLEHRIDHGSAEALEAQHERVEPGEAGPVRTNTAIVGLHGSSPDLTPTEFLEASLDTIREANARAARAVGPENYATAIKYFADRTAEFSADETDTQEGLEDQIDRWSDGFIRIADRDKPNPIELTNVYYAVARALPRELVKPELSAALIEHSLESLPTFSRETTMWLLNAASRLDGSQSPDELAVLVDLSVRMVGQLQRTRELRTALHAVRNLRPTPSTHSALRAIYENSYLLETSVDTSNPTELFGDLADTAASLRAIASNSITDPHLTLETQGKAKNCALVAVRTFKTLSQDPAITASELEKYRSQVQKIVDTYSKI